MLLTIRIATTTQKRSSTTSRSPNIDYKQEQLTVKCELFPTLVTYSVPYIVYEYDIVFVAYIAHYTLRTSVTHHILNTNSQKVSH